MVGEPGVISCRERDSCREKDPAREEGGGRGSVDGCTFEQVRNDQVGLFLRDYKRDISHTDGLFTLPNKCIAPVLSVSFLSHWRSNTKRVGRYYFVVCCVHRIARQ